MVFGIFLICPNVKEKSSYTDIERHIKVEMRCSFYVCTPSCVKFWHPMMSPGCPIWTSCELMRKMSKERQARWTFEFAVRISVDISAQCLPGMSKDTYFVRFGTIHLCLQEIAPPYLMVVQAYLWIRFHSIHVQLHPFYVVMGNTSNNCITNEIANKCGELVKLKLLNAFS